MQANTASPKKPVTHTMQGTRNTRQKLLDSVRTAAEKAASEKAAEAAADRERKRRDQHAALRAKAGISDERCSGAARFPDAGYTVRSMQGVNIAHNGITAQFFCNRHRRSFDRVRLCSNHHPTDPPSGRLAASVSGPIQLAGAHPDPNYSLHPQATACCMRPLCASCKQQRFTTAFVCYCGATEEGTAKCRLLWERHTADPTRCVLDENEDHFFPM